MRCGYLSFHLSGADLDARANLEHPCSFLHMLASEAETGFNAAVVFQFAKYVSIKGTWSIHLPIFFSFSPLLKVSESP